MSRARNLMKPMWFGKQSTRKEALAELNRVLLGRQKGAGDFSLHELPKAWETATGLPWVFAKTRCSAEQIVEDIDTVIGFLRPLLSVVEWNENSPLEEWASRYFMVERLETGRIATASGWSLTTFSLGVKIPAKGFAIFADADVDEAGVAIRYNAVKYGWRVKIWPVKSSYLVGKDPITIARHESETLAGIVTFLLEGQPFKEEAA